jgi:hypothetical protein
MGAGGSDNKSQNSDNDENANMVESQAFEALSLGFISYMDRMIQITILPSPFLFHVTELLQT